MEEDHKAVLKQPTQAAGASNNNANKDNASHDQNMGGLDENNGGGRERQQLDHQHQTPTTPGGADSKAQPNNYAVTSYKSP